MPKDAGRKKNSLAGDDEMALLSANAPRLESILTNAPYRHRDAKPAEPYVKEKEVIWKGKKWWRKQTRSKRARLGVRSAIKARVSPLPHQPPESGPDLTTTKTVVGLDHRRRVFLTCFLSLIVFPCVFPFIVVRFSSSGWSGPLFGRRPFFSAQP